MLSDILQSSRQSLERNGLAQKRASEKAQYEALLVKVEESIRSALEVLDCAMVARDELQLKFELTEGQIEDLYAPMRSIGEQLDEGLPEGSTAQALNAAVNGLSKRMNVLWSSQLRPRALPLGSLLETFAQFSDDPLKMQQTVSQLSADRDVMPRNRKAILQYKNVIEEAEAQVRKLNADQEVQRFFQKVIQGTATIEDITTKVDEWIRAHGLARKLKISIQE